MDNKKYPMPDSVSKMTKEDLWEWFSRREHASQETTTLDRQIFNATTKLHPSYYRFWNAPWTIITLQAQRIEGLELQMAQMQKGYKKKLDKIKTSENL